MNKFSNLLYFTLIFYFYGCGNSLSEWTIDELYAQKIEGTSKILYKYNAWGGLDSNANGFIILDSSEDFKINLKNELPFYFLSEIPNSSHIEGITHDCYGSCGESYNKTNPIYRPMKTENSVSNEINVITRIFQYRGYSEKDHALERYVFERFNETSDSSYSFII